jgi:predicted MFS family arabinose efflux permease
MQPTWMQPTWMSRGADVPALTREAGARDATRATRPAPVPGPDRRKHGARFGAGFWIVGYAFAVAMAFSTVPAPLYVLYQARDHFSAFMVSVIFAAYAVGVTGSLFLAGHISDWLGLRLPYMVTEALMLAAVLGLTLTPETVERPRPRPRYRPQRVSVPPAHRSLFYAAGFAAAAEFALFGLFTSLAPGFIVGVLHQHSHALAGFAAFVVFGAAALTQIVVSRAVLRRQLSIGFSALAVGLVLVTVAVWLPSLALLLIGGALAGGGAGAAFKGSISTVISIAPDRARGEALAGLFLAAYVGLVVPVLGLGIATQLVSTQVAVLGFAAVLLLVVAAVSVRLLRRPVGG